MPECPFPLWSQRRASKAHVLVPCGRPRRRPASAALAACLCPQREPSSLHSSARARRVWSLAAAIAARVLGRIARIVRYGLAPSRSAPPQVYSVSTRSTLELESPQAVVHRWPAKQAALAVGGHLLDRCFGVVRLLQPTRCGSLRRAQSFVTARRSCGSAVTATNVGTVQFSQPTLRRTLRRKKNGQGQGCAAACCSPRARARLIGSPGPHLLPCPRRIAPAPRPGAARDARARSEGYGAPRARSGRGSRSRARDSGRRNARSRPPRPPRAARAPPARAPTTL